jgi:hypothetical protein
MALMEGKGGSVLVYDFGGIRRFEEELIPM